MNTTSDSRKHAIMFTWVDASSRIADAPPSRMHTVFVGHELKMGDVSVLIHSPQYFHLHFLSSGKESDGGHIADAVRIIKDSKENKDDYKSLSKNDQATLIALLQSNREQRDTGIVGKSQLRLHDVRTTMEKVDIEVSCPSVSPLTDSLSQY